MLNYTDLNRTFKFPTPFANSKQHQIDKNNRSLDPVEVETHALAPILTCKQNNQKNNNPPFKLRAQEKKNDLDMYGLKETKRRDLAKDCNNPRFPNACRLWEICCRPPSPDKKVDSCTQISKVGFSPPFSPPFPTPPPVYLGGNVDERRGKKGVVELEQREKNGSAFGSVNQMCAA